MNERRRSLALSAMATTLAILPGIGPAVVAGQPISDQVATRSTGGNDVSGTGADFCTDVVVIPLTVAPARRAETVVILGNASGVTGPDCQPTFGIVWWEGFHLDACADVLIDFCDGADPDIQPGSLLAGSCSPDGSCGPIHRAAETGIRKCPEGNLSLRFESLPSGTYYYPVTTKAVADKGFGGSYRMNLTAVACDGTCEGCRGACCDVATRTCEDDVADTDCVGPTQTFSRMTPCCQVECRPQGDEFDAMGVKLLDRVPLTAFDSGSTRANDVWGYVSPGGREYAIIGLTQGTGFVDVTDPTESVVIADISDAASTWSDMATFGEYAYNVNESGGGIQIIDLTRIDDGIVELVGSADGGVTTAHNIFVNANSGFAYACDTNLGLGFVVFDLTDPAAPRRAGQWNEPTSPNQARSQAHDIFVVSYDECPHVDRAGQPCEIAFAFSGGAGVKIIDVTDKDAIVTLSTHIYPTVAFCHQGWLTPDKRFLLFGDEFDERAFNLPATTYVVDIQDLANPFEVASFSTGLCTIDHNLMVTGDLAFEANYTSGLRVFDIKDVTLAHEVALFDTHPGGSDLGFDGAWGVYSDLPSGTILVSDMQRGLFVLALCGPPAAGKIDLADYALLQTCIGRAPLPSQCHAADLDCDGNVDLLDLAILVLESQLNTPP